MNDLNIVNKRDFLNKFVLRRVNNIPLLIPLNECPENLVTLNTSGVFIWENLNKGLSFGKLARLMSDKYKVSQKVIMNDIKKFILDIQNKKYQKEKIDRILNENIKLKRIPIHGSIELTSKCNLNCIHCYAKNERKSNDLSFQRLKKIFDQLIETGCLFLQLTGGECLLKKDFDKIYLYIRKNGIIPIIMTNATLLNDNLLKIFKKYPPYSVMISLYGGDDVYHDKITKVKGSFKKTLSNIIKLKKAGIKTWITIVIMKDNFSNLSAIKHLIQKIGLPVVFYPFLIPALRGGQEPLSHSLNDNQCAVVLRCNKSAEFNKRKYKIKRSSTETIFPCNAGQQSFHINSEGKLFMCKIERDVGFSLLESLFKENWSKLSKIRRKKLRLPSICINCKEKKKCEVCPPIMRLFDSIDDSRIYCRRIQIRKKILL